MPRNSFDLIHQFFHINEISTVDTNDKTIKN